MRENRLIYRTIANQNSLNKNAGVQQITSPKQLVGTTPQSAATNVQNQNKTAVTNQGGLIPTATIPNTGAYSVNQSGLDKANADQSSYYIQHGSRDQGIDANIVNLQARLTHLQNGGDALPSGVQDPILKAQLAAANAAEAKSIQDQLANIEKAKQAAIAAGPTGSTPLSSTNPALSAAATAKQARMNGQSTTPVTVPPPKIQNVEAGGASTTSGTNPNNTPTNQGSYNLSLPNDTSTSGQQAGGTTGQTISSSGGQTQPTTPNQGSTPQTNGAPVTQDPFVSSITSIIGPQLSQGIQSTLDSATAQKNTILNAVVQGKMDQDTAVTNLSNIRDATIKAALDHYGDQLDFNTKQDTLEKTAAENAKADQQDIVALQQSQADLNNHIAYHNQDIQNTETELQNRNAAAKLGINFDTGGLKWMQVQQQKGVDALNFISQQMAISKSTFAADQMKIVRDYTQNISQASQDATTRYNQAWKDFNDSKRSANADYSTGVSNTKQFYANLNEKYAGDVNTLDKNLGDTYKDLAGKMIDQHTALYRIQFDKQQAAMSQVKDIWTATGGQMTPALQSSLDAAKSAGVSEDRLAGFSTGQLTMTGVKNSFEAKGYNYLNPDTWHDQPSKDVMSLLRGITFTSPDKMLSAAGDVGDVLAQGDVSKARNKVINYAVSTLPDDTKKSVQTGLNIERQVGALQGFIAQNQDALKNAGIYERKGQELLNLVNKSQDPTLRKFYSMITKINATEMHDLYGARLTETEIGFGKDFLAQTNEPLKNVIGKLDTLKSDIEGQNNQILGQALGTGSAYLTGDNGGTNQQPKIQTAPSTDDWMKNYQQYISKPQANLPRTDRNNNPTAMTTAAASSMGLVQGKDFIIGDAFPANEGGNSMHTAKFTGNPIDTTIKAIDQGGLFTKGGAPRWTYLNKLGITQDDWNGMDRQGKIKTIEKMYKMEGGSGVLFNTMS